MWDIGYFPYVKENMLRNFQWILGALVAQEILSKLKYFY